jgi:hypothetical protein
MPAHERTSAIFCRAGVRDRERGAAARRAPELGGTVLICAGLAATLKPARRPASASVAVAPATA